MFITQLVHLAALVDDLLAQLILVSFVLADGVQPLGDLVKVSLAQLKQLLEGTLGPAISRLIPDI
jgi:hypothetical protein